jgi:hypothetical protein
MHLVLFQISILLLIHGANGILIPRGLVLSHNSASNARPAAAV